MLAANLRPPLSLNFIPMDATTVIGWQTWLYLRRWCAQCITQQQCNLSLPPGWCREGGAAEPLPAETSSAFAGVPLEREPSVAASFQSALSGDLSRGESLASAHSGNASLARAGSGVPARSVSFSRGEESTSASASSAFFPLHGIL